MRSYNCTIFAYGQTGTGKTYTMTGDVARLDEVTAVSCPDFAGIIPRTLFYLFKTLDAQEVEYSIRLSFIEIYNEELRDLFNDSTDSKSLKIFEGTNKAINVKGLDEVPVNTVKDGLDWFKAGCERREVA